MSKARIACALLLALPLIVFGGNYFVGAFELPEGDGQSGDQLLAAMRVGGLMTWVAVSHVLIGILLIAPRTRFVAALLQLPVTLGMVAFHATMLPAGVALAGFLLILNLIVVLDPQRLRSLLG